MASSYHLIVKKSLDKNRIESSLPEHIQRGWKRIYTLEEQEFNARSFIIGPDVQIPNSIIRQRLDTKKILINENAGILSKVFELPDELFMKLSNEHKQSDSIDEEKLSFNWYDEDNSNETNYKKIVKNKNDQQKRQYEDYPFIDDDYNVEPLSLNDLIREIRTNVGKNLNNTDSKIITDLIQIISRQKPNQIMNIYDELVSAQLINKIFGVPKLLQALQIIQKTFEQIAVKTNVASIQTIINLLLDKDNTYRVAIDLLNSFNKNIKKHGQCQLLKIEEKSNNISNHDQSLFDVLVKDRINRLSPSELNMLVHDLQTTLNIDQNIIRHNRDEQIKFISEQLNRIFIRAHFDGIKTLFNAMQSPITISLNNFINKIENTLQNKLTEHDHIIIESYIHDYLTVLNDHELKLFYERLIQQGILKRVPITSEMNQMITMSLMNKIDTYGLGTLIENMKDIQFDNNSINELIKALTHIEHHIQTEPSVSLEQIQKQLDVSYFIETRNLSKSDIYELSKAVDLYSISHVNLSKEATNEEYFEFLEYLKAPFIRRCIQRILKQIDQENITDFDKLSNKFYNEHIVNLFNELIYGSEEFNRNLLFHSIKTKLKKNKELVEKLYRQMLKDKLIQIDTQLKIDTHKKKSSRIIHEINEIFIDIEDRLKQEQMIDLFDKLDITLPERIKSWYKTKANKQKKDLSISKKKIKTTRPNSSSFKTRSSQKIAITMNKREKNNNIISNVPTPLEMKSERKKESSPITNHDQQILKFSAITTSKEKLKKSSTILSSNIKDIVESINPIELKPEVDNQQLVENPSNMENVQNDMEFKIQETNDLLQESNDLDNGYLEKNDKLLDQKSTEIFQIDNIIENETFNETLNQDLNPTFDHSFLITNEKQEMHSLLSGQPSEFINNSEYVKSKAPRLLAKTLPSSIIRQSTEEETITKSLSSSNLTIINGENIFSIVENRKFSGSSMEPFDQSPISTVTLPSDHRQSSPKNIRRSVPKPLKNIEDIYINSLAKALTDLFSRSEYDSTKLKKIHEELIASGHMSPLNEFYRSTNEAIRVTLDHCITYTDLLNWTLSLLQTNNKPNLIDFGHNLYIVAIELDFRFVTNIDVKRCAIEIQDILKHALQTINETDLREINSYLNASQIEKLIHSSKKLNVTSKDRMISDLNSLLLHLIQIYHTFEPKYRPMQIRIREIGEKFKSRAVIDLMHKLNDIEKHLAKTFSITLFGLSKHMNEIQFLLIK